MDQSLIWGFWQGHNFPGMEETSPGWERNRDRSMMQRDGISIWTSQNPFSRQPGFVLETRCEREPSSWCPAVPVAALCPLNPPAWAAAAAASDIPWHAV